MLIFKKDKLATDIVQLFCLLGTHGRLQRSSRHCMFLECVVKRSSYIENHLAPPEGPNDNMTLSNYIDVIQ